VSFGPDECGIFARFSSDGVVDVCDVDDQVQLATQVLHDVKQRHAIDASTDGK
jgi:hypothetical protein